MRTKELFKFIHERHNIHELKAAGKPKPWTKDPILQTFRFCNAYRELDTVTEWITDNWRTPWAGDPNLWFTLAVARLINWPDTLQEMTHALRSGDTISWNPRAFLHALNKRQAAGLKTFTGAYMVRSSARPKGEYLAHEVLTPMWKAKEFLQPKPDQTLAEYHEGLMCFTGMGSFMAAQVIADLKYVKPLLQAPDWWTWAASGPGSLRGLNRVCGHDLEARWEEAEWLDTLQALASEVAPLLEKFGMPSMHNQDLQNCLCEFDKYERARLGEGRPRSLYPGV